MNKVCVQGLGFVGAAMAVAVAAACDENGEPLFDVTGVDLPNDQGLERVDRLNGGDFPFSVSDERLMAEARSAVERGNLRGTTDPSVYADADVVLVDVNLDVDQSGDLAKVNLTPFRKAIRCLGARIKTGALVIVETTVPPGTCSRVVAPELEAAFAERGLPRDAFLLAHSYERVMPGEHYLDSITNFWRVYSGHSDAAADACEAFLCRVISTAEYPLTRLANTTASELAKVMENSFRATNIAFIEEWARFSEAMSVDLYSVIDAIRMRPTHSNMRQPGFGVGGYCLTKDPMLPGIAARQLFERPDLTFPFSEAAVRTNNLMPLVSVERLEALLGGVLEGKRILLMGVSYRQDVADTRYSPSETFARAASARGAEISAHDPYVRYWPELDMPVAADLPASDTLDGIVLAVPHKGYGSLDLKEWLGTSSARVLDANNVLTSAQRAALDLGGITHASIGRGETPC